MSIAGKGGTWKQINSVIHLSIVEELALHTPFEVDARSKFVGGWPHTSSSSGINPILKRHKSFDCVDDATVWWMKLLYLDYQIYSRA